MAEQPAVRLHRGVWSHPEFAEIADALHETTGLVFPPNRRESAESGMRRAMTAACISDPHELRRMVMGAGELRDILITELTIGETFFLREQGQFDFLRDVVLPEMRSTVLPRALRMWSAGCATGEEPYSLAMTLKEAAWPGLASILGTDLAFARLVAARRARYTAWSMRGVSEPIIERYFERRGKQFVLRPDIRTNVDFRVLNLASAEYPSLASGIEQMDVVFCRNVLIYFDLPTVAAIASRLIASLAPGGWLFLGASDPPIAEFIPCEVVLTGAGLAYRPPGTTDASRATVAGMASWMGIESPATWAITAAPDVAPAEEPLSVESVLDLSTRTSATSTSAREQAAPASAAEPLGDCEAAYERGDYEAAILLARAAIESGDDSETVRVVLVRGLANRGELEAASEASVIALDRYRLSAELSHLHAILLAEAGRYVEASVVAKQALYLNPQYTIAHLALGDALSRTGDAVNARRAFRNAEALLQGLAADSPVPGGDGAAAGQLLRIARYRLETLAAGAAAGRR